MDNVGRVKGLESRLEYLSSRLGVVDVAHREAFETEYLDLLGELCMENKSAARDYAVRYARYKGW